MRARKHKLVSLLGMGRRQPFLALSLFTKRQHFVMIIIDFDGCPKLSDQTIRELGRYPFVVIIAINVAKNTHTREMRKGMGC